VGSRRSWVPFVLVVMCVAAEMIAAGTRIEAWARPALITVVVGLATIAVGVSLYWSMGLVYEAPALRMILAVPIFLAVLLAVALMLEANLHRESALPTPTRVASLLGAG
jgi:hypothetical protein